MSDKSFATRSRFPQKINENLWRNVDFERLLLLFVIASFLYSDLVLPRSHRLFAYTLCVFIRHRIYSQREAEQRRDAYLVYRSSLTPCTTLIADFEPHETFFIIRKRNIASIATRYYTRFPISLLSFFSFEEWRISHNDPLLTLYTVCSKIWKKNI